MSSSITIVTTTTATTLPLNNETGNDNNNTTTTTTDDDSNNNSNKSAENISTTTTTTTGMNKSLISYQLDFMCALLFRSVCLPNMLIQLGLLNDTDHLKAAYDKYVMSWEKMTESFSGDEGRMTQFLRNILAKLWDEDEDEVVVEVEVKEEEEIEIENQNDNKKDNKDKDKDEEGEREGGGCEGDQQQQQQQRNVTDVTFFSDLIDYLLVVTESVKYDESVISIGEMRKGVSLLKRELTAIQSRRKELKGTAFHNSWKDHGATILNHLIKGILDVGYNEGDDDDATNTTLPPLLAYLDSAISVPDNNNFEPLAIINNIRNNDIKYLLGDLVLYPDYMQHIHTTYWAGHNNGDGSFGIDFVSYLVMLMNGIDECRLAKRHRRLYSIWHCLKWEVNQLKERITNNKGEGDGEGEGEREREKETKAYDIAMDRLQRLAKYYYHDDDDQKLKIKCEGDRDRDDKGENDKENIVTDKAEIKGDDVVMEDKDRDKDKDEKEEEREKNPERRNYNVTNDEEMYMEVDDDVVEESPELKKDEDDMRRRRRQRNKTAEILLHDVDDVDEEEKKKKKKEEEEEEDKVERQTNQKEITTTKTKITTDDIIISSNNNTDKKRKRNTPSNTTVMMRQTKTATEKNGQLNTNKDEKKKKKKMRRRMEMEKEEENKIEVLVE